MHSQSEIQKSSKKGLAPPPAIIFYIKNLLEELIQLDGCCCNSIFNSNHIPSIPLENFIKQIQHYTKVSSQCLIIAIIYLDRYNLRNEHFSLNNHNVHKIFLTCLMLAAKFQDDIYYDNKTFELAGGVNVTQLHQFEFEIAISLDFDLFVSEQEYQNLLTTLKGAYELGYQEEETLGMQILHEKQESMVTESMATESMVTEQQEVDLATK